MRSNAQAGFENIALWHERDISHSSVERVIIPDSFILTDYLVRKTEWLIDGLAVYPARMKSNLDRLGGVTVSGQLLLELTRKGVTREDAYQMVQPLAMRVWDEGASFRELVLGDERIAEHLSRAELDALFDVSNQLRNVDKIFERVFGDERQKSLVTLES